MNPRYFAALLLVASGTVAAAGGCGGNSGTEAATRDGSGGAAQTGAGGSGGNRNTTAGATGGGAGGAVDGSGGAKADASGGGGMPSDGGSGSGGAVDARVRDTGDPDAVKTACEQVAAGVDRTCTANNDCVAVTHLTDYIGQVRLLGIKSSEMAHFTELEKSCKATMKTFNLPGTTADDGSLVDAAARSVICEAGVCTTYAAACTQPCAPDHVCITCGTMSVCSQTCGMGSCTEAPRTLCLGGASTNGGEGDFCFEPKFMAGFMSSSCHR